MISICNKIFIVLERGVFTLLLMPRPLVGYGILVIPFFMHEIVRQHVWELLYIHSLTLILIDCSL